MKLVKKVSLIFFIFLFFSCSEEINKKKIAKAYVDIMVSHEEFSNNLDTLSEIKIEILAKYNLDSSEYENSIKDLQANEELWKDFYKEVYIYLDTLKAEVGIN